MWPFSRKATLLSSGFLQGWTDWHSHILPGVDDGVQSLDESLAVLHWYAEQGVQGVWLTPHIMEDYPNRPEDLRVRFSLLEQAWDGPVEIHLAAEHMLDALFEVRLAAGDIMPIGPESDCLLVETSCFNAPMNFEALLDRVKQQGLRPILAHPERYYYMNDTAYRRLYDTGVEFQLNVPSVCGAYGPVPALKARKLLAAGFYSHIGSDLHRLIDFQRSLSIPLKFNSALLSL